LDGSAADWLGVAAGAMSGAGVCAVGGALVGAVAADWCAGAFAKAPLADMTAAASTTGTASNPIVFGVFKMDTS
jgi:hypothetical protein